MLAVVEKLRQNNSRKNNAECVRYEDEVVGNNESMPCATRVDARCEDSKEECCSAPSLFVVLDDLHGETNEHHQDGECERAVAR
jgi:hypothetical protein